MKSSRFLGVAGIAMLSVAAEMPEHATRLSPPPALETSALKIGDKAPPFSLPAADGTTFVLADSVRRGPLALIFYRGSW